MIFNIILPIGFGIGAFLTTYLIKLVIPYLNIRYSGNLHIYYYNAYNNWYGEGKNLPIFSFEQFIKFYNLNPEEWEIFDKDSEITLPARNLGKHRDYTYEYDYQPVFFPNMFEYKKYHDWAVEKANELKKVKALEKKNQAERTILEAVQKDMNAIQQTEDELAKIISNSNYNYSENHTVTNTGDTYIERTYCGVASNGKKVRIVK
jgi:hypothetical protein